MADAFSATTRVMDVLRAAGVPCAVGGSIAMQCDPRRVGGRGGSLSRDLAKVRPDLRAHPIVGAAS